MKQCQELLYDTGSNGEVYLHCLGNAIKRGITLALTLVQESDNAFGYEANTSTIDLIGNSFALSFPFHAKYSFHSGFNCICFVSACR